MKSNRFYKDLERYIMGIPKRESELKNDNLLIQLPVESRQKSKTNQVFK